MATEVVGLTHILFALCFKRPNWRGFGGARDMGIWSIWGRSSALSGSNRGPLGPSSALVGRDQGLLGRSGELLLKAPLWGASSQGARTSPKPIGEYSLSFAVLRIPVWQTATKDNDAQSLKHKIGQHAVCFAVL